MALAVSAPAPGFVAASTLGPIDLHHWKGSTWTAMFCVPFAFTPVCTTELAAIATRQSEFSMRGVTVLAVGVDRVDSYRQWVSDIEHSYGATISYPLVADSDRSIAVSYGMIRAEDVVDALPVAPGRWMKTVTDFTVRTLFLITPDNHIALTVSYPPNVGIDLDEVFRVLDELRTLTGQPI